MRGGRAFLRVSSKYVATLKGLWYIMDEPYVLHIQYHSWISVRSTLWRNTSEYRRKSKKYYFGTFLFQKFWRMTLGKLVEENPLSNKSFISSKFPFIFQGFETWIYHNINIFWKLLVLYFSWNLRTSCEILWSRKRTKNLWNWESKI